MKASLSIKGTVIAAVSIFVFAAADRADAVVIQDIVNVFGVGCSGSPALDPDNNPVPCGPVVSWNHNVDYDPGHLKNALLTITAEGVDARQEPDGPGPEIDRVFVNGTEVGTLTNQSFYTPLFNLQPGPGALPGFTELTMSVFDVTPFLLPGLNTIDVVVDPANWILEVEVSDLRVEVPEPATFMLFGFGLAGLGLARRNRRHG